VAISGIIVSRSSAISLLLLWSSGEGCFLGLPFSFHYLRGVECFGKFQLELGVSVATGMGIATGIGMGVGNGGESGLGRHEGYIALPSSFLGAEMELRMDAGWARLGISHSEREVLEP